MAKLADAQALGACGETLGGSTPLPPIVASFLLKRDRDHKGKGDLISIPIAKKIFPLRKGVTATCLLGGSVMEGKTTFSPMKFFYVVKKLRE